MSAAPRLSLVKRSALETIGSAFLVAAVIGSGIMAQRLADGNLAIALLCNTLATAGVLYALIATLGPLSGAHFNPIITLAEVLSKVRPPRETLPYLVAQFAGGIAGALVANAMFGLPYGFSTHDRSGTGQLLGEAVATFGLVFLVFLCVRSRPEAVPFLVAGYITAAYWFTSSTSFANPAVTVARMFSESFAGIRPSAAPGFILAQCVGGAAALASVRWVLGKPVPQDFSSM